MAHRLFAWAGPSKSKSSIGTGICFPRGPLQGQDDEYICTVNIWDAIHEMRRLSEKGISFSFTFMSCNLTDGTSEGVIEVMHGRLLSREVERHHKNAEYVERYLNLDTMKTRRFYQPLLMTFNGEKVTV